MKIVLPSKIENILFNFRYMLQNNMSCMVFQVLLLTLEDFWDYCLEQVYFPYLRHVLKVVKNISTKKFRDLLEKKIVPSRHEVPQGEMIPKKRIVYHLSQNSESCMWNKGCIEFILNKF